MAPLRGLNMRFPSREAGARAPVIRASYNASPPPQIRAICSYDAREKMIRNELGLRLSIRPPILPLFLPSVISPLSVFLLLAFHFVCEPPPPDWQRTKWKASERRSKQRHVKTDIKCAVLKIFTPVAIWRVRHIRKLTGCDFLIH